MSRHDLDAIKRRLADRVDDLVARFFPHASKDGNYWRMGSIHGEPGHSLCIWRKGPKRGEWWDASAGTWGDGLALVQQAMGGDFKRALEWAAGWTGVSPIDDETPAQRRAREARQAREAAEREAREAEDAARKRRAAKALFLDGRPLAAGDPGWSYLAGRGIHLDRLPQGAGAVGALRYHASAPAADKVRRPALLALVVDGAGVLTVHRHFLHRLASGQWVKASHADVPADMRMGKKDAKQAFSSFGGGIIPVWRGEGLHDWRSDKVGPEVLATEGLEDALAWALHNPAMRCGAVVGLNNLGRIWLPPQVTTVLWHRHRGDGPEAVAAYERQRAALEERGLFVADIWAPEPHKDATEWLEAEEERERVSA